MPDDWGNSPFDRLRGELLQRIDQSDRFCESKIDRMEQDTNKRLDKLEGETNKRLDKLDETKAAKWIETAAWSAMGAVSLALLMGLLALAKTIQ